MALQAAAKMPVAHASTSFIPGGPPSRSAAATRATLNGALSASGDVSVKILEEKSMGELRLMAKERGIRGDTKAELIKLLSSGLSAPKQANGSATGNGRAPPPPSAANGSAAPAPVSSAVDVKMLQTMPISQLKAMAHSRGIYGGTRAEMIKEIVAAAAKSAPARSAPPAAAPAAAVAAPPPPTTPAGEVSVERQLQSKPLSVLKAMARQRGLRGETKEQLIQALLGASPTPSKPVPAASPASSYTPPPPTASSSSPPSSSSAPAALSAADLATRPLGELRALAKAKGLRGDTRSELIALLTGSAPKASSRTQTAVKEAVEPSSVLPPFESQAAISSLAVESFAAAQLASEVSSLREAMESMKARDAALEEEKNSLIEQANFLRNVLVGGIGLALVPLILPVSINSSSNSSLQSSSTSVSTTTARQASQPQIVLPPPAPLPAEPKPIVKSVGLEEFCATMPATLRSSASSKLCAAIPVEPAPIVKAVTPEELCKSLPVDSLSPITKRLCESLTEPLSD